MQPHRNQGNHGLSYRLALSRFYPPGVGGGGEDRAGRRTGTGDVGWQSRARDADRRCSPGLGTGPVSRVGESCREDVGARVLGGMRSVLHLLFRLSQIQGFCCDIPVIYILIEFRARRYNKSALKLRLWTVMNTRVLAASGIKPISVTPFLASITPSLNRR